MRSKIIELINDLESRHDFEDEFYLTFTGQLNEGDISDWHNNHFDDNVELGCDVGQTMEADYVVGRLKAILKEFV